MTDLGTGTIFTYDYTVNLDDGSNYMDGSANVSLTGAYNGSGEIADPPSNATFVITTLDTTPPVITLVGLSVVSGEIGYGGYSDDGASWADNVDGSGFIFSNSGYFDNNTLGTYVIGYEYTDGAGNIGTGVTRTVNIVDTTAPFVYLS